MEENRRGRGDTDEEGRMNDDEEVRGEEVNSVGGLRRVRGSPKGGDVMRLRRPGGVGHNAGREPDRSLASELSQASFLDFLRPRGCWLLLFFAVAVATFTTTTTLRKSFAFAHVSLQGPQFFARARYVHELII